MQNLQKKIEAFTRMLTIMDELREQCPWDKKQTFETLRNLTIEETYELADAIEKHTVLAIPENDEGIKYLIDAIKHVCDD